MSDGNRKRGSRAFGKKPQAEPTGPKVRKGKKKTSVAALQEEVPEQVMEDQKVQEESPTLEDEVNDSASQDLPSPRFQDSDSEEEEDDQPENQVEHRHRRRNDEKSNSNEVVRQHRLQTDEKAEESEAKSPRNSHSGSGQNTRDEALAASQKLQDAINSLDAKLRLRKCDLVNATTMDEIEEIENDLKLLERKRALMVKKPTTARPVQQPFSESSSSSSSSTRLPSLEEKEESRFLSSLKHFTKVHADTNIDALKLRKHLTTCRSTWVSLFGTAMDEMSVQRYSKILSYTLSAHEHYGKTAREVQEHHEDFQSLDDVDEAILEASGGLLTDALNRSLASLKQSASESVAQYATRTRELIYALKRSEEDKELGVSWVSGLRSSFVKIRMFINSHPTTFAEKVKAAEEAELAESAMKEHTGMTTSEIEHFLDPKSNSKSNTKSNSSAKRGRSKSDLYCEVHGWCSHTTADCRGAKKVKGGVTDNSSKESKAQEQAPASASNPSSSLPSKQNGNKKRSGGAPECKHCHRKHWGACWNLEENKEDRPPNWKPKGPKQEAQGGH